MADRPWLLRHRGAALATLVAFASVALLWVARGHGVPPAVASEPVQAVQATQAADSAPFAPAVVEGDSPSVFSELFSRGQSNPVIATSTRLLPSADDLMQRSKAEPGTPEGRLLRVYALMAAGNGNQAMEEARQLSQDVPTFSLAHLVYADLLKARTAPLATFGAAASSVLALPMRDGAPAVESPRAERLKDLSAEARARVRGATGLPPAGALPAQFVFIAPTVRNAIAVDASRSRLYLFENTPTGMVLKRDYYVSVGKLGTAKRTEGDLRTPLGVYFVTGRLTKAKLADRYGASAMVLNYPNQYDQLRGRTGSGIWLHGVESSYFSRAPQATDGCVALSNTDLLRLTEDVDRQATPVVIADRLDWVAPGATTRVPDDFAHAFDAWRSARQQPDPRAELAFYAGVAHPAVAVPASAGAAAAPHWIDVLRAERSRAGSQAAQLTQLSVLSWRDQDDVMLVTYNETSARDAHPRVKRQYWLRREGHWGIVFDGAVS